MEGPWCFFVPGCQEAEAWVGERALQILRGKASDVATGMRRSATLRDLGPRGAKRGSSLPSPSGDTEAYWAFHKAQEHTRNHLSRMASHDFRKAA